MNEPNKKVIPLKRETSADPERMAVTLTVGELRQVVREEVGKERRAYDTLIRPEVLAQKLGVPVSWVYEQSRLKNIPSHKLGKYIRFNLTEVIESQKEKTP